ncbi:IS200/IS605 family element transposase accessory protein TnpB [Candidatus Micrarchaeota archaeon]|nr:IS200/IS605 family element transposase accessory protein TnpB [Candidatus Micrarchaeota archaeon]
MLISKTLRCKVFNPTEKKLELLNGEYLNFQIYARCGKNFGVYSLTKSTFNFKYKRKSRKRKQPMPLAGQSTQFRITNNKLTPYWFKLPVKGKRGGIWLPIKPHENIDSSWEVREAKVIKRKKDFWIYITIRKEVSLKTSYSSVLALDIGEKVIAAAVLSSVRKPIFLGREVRGIRRHHAWLRKRLQERKLFKKLKEMRGKEGRRVELVLHEVSKYIVELAEENNSIIVLGDLKGIRKGRKGKRFNRIINSFPFNKLSFFIEYKAHLKGIAVVKIGEEYTSKICSRCGERGKRIKQGLFKCPNCGYQANADFNGAMNILKRSLEHVSKDGAVAFSPEPPMTEKTRAEAHV